MSPIVYRLDELLDQLRADWPTVTFEAGESPGGGYWLRAEQGDWLWIRHRVTSVESLQSFITAALFAARSVGSISG